MKHVVVMGLICVSALAGCQTTTGGIASPSLSQRASDAFASNAWPQSYLANRQCSEPVNGYYSAIGSTKNMAERNSAFVMLGYDLVAHPRKAGQMTIADNMPQKVRVDFHATNSAFGGDMDPHDIAAMACFVR